MASGYSSSKLLMSLDTVKFLLANHTEDHFPFLALPDNTRHRTTFHATLSRLLFASLDDNGERFEAFMQPILDVIAKLAVVPESDFRQEHVKNAVIGICRDLRGITASTHNRRTYSALFDCLYPGCFPVFVRAATVWYDEPAVTTALLKFMGEFVYNKAQVLPSSSSLLPSSSPLLPPPLLPSSPPPV
jgi:exportin-7